MDRGYKRNNARQGNGKNKLRVYKTYNYDYKTEHSLQCLMSRCHKSAYSKFCCGVAPIRMKIGDMNTYLQKGDYVLIA